MRRFKSLTERKENQAKAREKRAKLARKIATKPSASEQQLAKARTQTSTPPVELAPAPRPRRPWAEVRSGSAHFAYQARTTNEIIGPQPWTHGIVNALLEAADKGCITLCLAWPAKLMSLPLVHALANVERVFAKDLRGLRTLLFPGTHACRVPLHSVLVNRHSLAEFYRKLWVKKSTGLTEPQVCTSSTAFLAVLGALNDITLSNPDLPNPSLAELIPAFVFDPEKSIWGTTAANPLERTLSKVNPLAHRRALRQKVRLEWAVPDKAPGALMVIHNSAKKGAWRIALSARALEGQGRPEALLLDATQAAAGTNYAAVKQIPDFLEFAQDNGLASAGAVIVTDDPKSFFILRKRLYDLNFTFAARVWAAEADEGFLSENPVPLDWRPFQRSNTNFSVSIVDRDASQVALEFQRLSASASNEERRGHQALLQVSSYLLRLSNMPAGYADFTAASSEDGEGNFRSQQDAWTFVKLALDAVLSSGELNEVRDSVEQAVVRAEQLIDDWNDATPIASRMLAEVRKHAVASKQGISLVLPSYKYVLLAHRFLQRKLGEDWPGAEAHIEWLTLSAVREMLSGIRKSKHFAFIGINNDVLRVLLTHPEVPHGTALMVAYRKAESTLTTLLRMKEVGQFKAYRGRIGLLAQELERRLSEIPNPLMIGKLREIPLVFKFDEGGHNVQSGDHAYFKFDLEDGGRAYASGWVYRYAPDEESPFRRTAAKNIKPGDFIFKMSDELRAKLESSLQLNDDGVSSVVNPVRILLKLYHDDVERRCGLLFKSTKRSALAREIHAKMVDLDPHAAGCRPGRVYYWLGLQQDDTRPHASRDAKYFRVFCKALGISEEATEDHWSFVRNARRLSQYLGRELAARYAEILFQPESAAAYRKVPEEVIRELQQEALRCVYRVEGVVPPPGRVTNSKKGEKNAHSQ